MYTRIWTISPVFLSSSTRATPRPRPAHHYADTLGHGCLCKGKCMGSGDPKGGDPFGAAPSPRFPLPLHLPNLPTPLHRTRRGRKDIRRVLGRQKTSLHSVVSAAQGISQTSPALNRPVAFLAYAGIETYAVMSDVIFFYVTSNKPHYWTPPTSPVILALRVPGAKVRWRGTSAVPATRPPKRVDHQKVVPQRPA